MEYTMTFSRMGNRKEYTERDIRKKIRSNASNKAPLRRLVSR